MDSKQIRFLLDQYFEGKTTRKEELLLQRFYIENQNLDTDLEKFRALFLYYNQAKKEVFQKPPLAHKIFDGICRCGLSFSVSWIIYNKENRPKCSRGTCVSGHR